MFIPSHIVNHELNSIEITVTLKVTHDFRVYSTYIT